MQDAHTPTSTPPLPSALPWALAFVALLAHLPCVAGYFAAEDWQRLAEAAGLIPVRDLPANPVGSVLYWRATWSLFRLSAPAYYGTSLLLWCACALLTARVARQLGLGRVGAAVAGLVAAGTPVAIVPVFWASAAGEILASLLALAALERWLAGGRRSAGIGLGLAALAALTRENALAMPLLLGLAAACGLGGARGARSSRGIAAAWAVALLLAVVAAVLLVREQPAVPLPPQLQRGPARLALDLGAAGGWLASPWQFAPANSSLLPIAGALVWLAWGIAARVAWRRGERAVAFALLFALAAIAPALLLHGPLRPYDLLLAVPAWGWAWGWLLRVPGERMLRALSSPSAPNAGGAAALLVAAASVAALGWAATRTMLWSRDDQGRLADPIAARSATAATAAKQIRSLPLTEHSTLVVLQAIRIDVPSTVSLPEGANLLAATPVYAALSGRAGLSLLVPAGATVRWTTHLDDAPLDAFVLMDSGDLRMRIWGTVTSARMYSALVAVAARQYWRARHDLWSVLELKPAEVAFVYQPQSLPFPPEHLDDTAPEFAQMLRQEGSAASYRVLNLFGKMFQAVRERPLEGAPAGEEQDRAPPLPSGPGQQP